VVYTEEPETQYLGAALIAVAEIHLSKPPGDILLFLTGQAEIDKAHQILSEHVEELCPGAPELIILPIYSALPSEVQSCVFEPTPTGARKLVIATNVAETSLTIPGIYYVVDPGYVKQSAYDPQLGMDSLEVVRISQAQARQRSGRAGRTGPGKCYRLYTEQEYQDEMLPNSIPDIQRTNLAHTILMLKAMGVDDLRSFDFMDPPPPEIMLAAFKALSSLSALDEKDSLTHLGHKMAELPMEPQLAKMLIASVEFNCTDQILTIVAMLSVPNVFYRPRDMQAEADREKAKFHQPEGDHLTLLATYDAWKTSGFSDTWCKGNFIHAQNMRRAKDVRAQLLGIMQRYMHDSDAAVSAKPGHQRHGTREPGRDRDRVRRAICAGFFRHAARWEPRDRCLRTLLEDAQVYIHPSSALYRRSPDWCVYHEVICTTREYCYNVIAVEPQWLVELAPQLFTAEVGNP
jgi:ATP-dependent RNA helicase DHX8/PRP22